MTADPGPPSPPTGGTSRRGPLPIGAGLLLVVALLAGLFLATAPGNDQATAGPTLPSTPPRTAAPTTTTLDPKVEIVARLREILRVRERAYHNRSPELLSTIYTTDCPCLESDRNAIKELLDRGYVWIGGSTSIEVHRVQRVTARQWLVVALFRSGALRIETESGHLIREEPAGGELFEFALAKPLGSDQWLLGRAFSIK